MSNGPLCVRECPQAVIRLSELNSEDIQQCMICFITRVENDDCELDNVRFEVLAFGGKSDAR